MTRTLATLAAVIITMVAAASCAGGTPDRGPLGDGGDPGSICVPLHPGGVLSWGATPLENKGSSVAVIKSVKLVGAQHTTLAVTYIVPSTRSYLYGAWRGYPPPPHPQPGVRWDERMTVPGATVQPGRTASLVAVIKEHGPVGRVRAIAVTYREGGGTYLMQTHYKLLLTTASCRT